MTLQKETVPGASEPNADKISAPKMVLESDLMALKQSHSTELNKLSEQIESLTKEVETVTAAKTVVETSLAETSGLKNALSTAQEALEASKSEADAAKTAATAFATILLNNRKTALQEKHGVAPDKVNDLSADQLTALELVLPEVSSAVTPGSNPQNLDAGPGGGGNISPNASGRDLMVAGLESERPSTS